MKDCEVLQYLEKEELYEILWVENAGLKKVSRFNLLFNREDETEFRKRIEEATQHR